VTEADLLRFVNAQSDVHDKVAKELTEGRKQTHWMWFVFPQLAGLGHSSMAQRYAILDLDQARRYLADPLLGSRLRHDVRLVMSHEGMSALDILGSPDDLKFRSCLTLCLLKRPRKTPTARCSSKLWINSMVARRILERWSCCAQRRLKIFRLEGEQEKGSFELCEWFAGLTSQRHASFRRIHHDRLVRWLASPEEPAGRHLDRSRRYRT
jgi:uncharacterized protein (DUF1810 family)